MKNEKGKIIGGLIGWKDKNTYILGTLAIYTKYQGKGYGKQLVDCFISKVKTINSLHSTSIENTSQNEEKESNEKKETQCIKQIDVQVHADNEQAIGFYQHLGFSQTKVIEKAYPRLKNPKAFQFSFML